MKRSREEGHGENGRQWPEVYPTPADEQHLFKLWTNASLKQSKLALVEAEEDEEAPHDEEAAVSTDEADAAERQCMQAIHAWCRQGWYYDPSFRRFSPFLEGLHPWPKYSYMLFKPSCNDDKVVEEGVDKCSGKEQKILFQEHPGVLERKYTMRFASTQSILNKKHLKQYLLRSFDGTLPRSIAYLQLGNTPKKTKVVLGKAGQSAVAHYVVIDDGTTSALNRELHRFLEHPEFHVDLIAINLNQDCCAQENVVIDPFFPAYPIALTENVFLFTPFQLLQVNGLSETDDDVRLSLYSRIMFVFHAILVCEKSENLAQTVGHAIETFPLRWEQDGLSTHQRGIRQNGNVIKVRSHLSYFAAPLSHGWLNTDTRALLSASCKLSKARTVLELGTWYGLSTNHITGHLLDSSTGPIRVFTVDKFANVASFRRPIRTVEPIHKMFYHYLRLETAHRNLQAGSESLIRQNSDGGIFTVKANCHDASRMLFDLGIVPDLVFVDCEKHTERLVELLENVRGYFPEATIVGDDYVFPSVQDGIASLPTHYPIITLREAYVLLPSSSSVSDKETWRRMVFEVRNQLDSTNIIDAPSNEDILCSEQGIPKAPIGRCMKPSDQFSKAPQQDGSVLEFATVNLRFPVYKLTFTEVQCLWKCCSRKLKLHNGDGCPEREKLISYIFSQLEQHSQFFKLWDDEINRLLAPLECIDLDDLVVLGQQGDGLGALKLARAFGIDKLHRPLRGCPTGRLLHEVCHSRRVSRRSFQFRKNWHRIFADVMQWCAPLHNSATLTPFDVMRFEAQFL